MEIGSHIPHPFNTQALQQEVQHRAQQGERLGNAEAEKARAKQGEIKQATGDPEEKKELPKAGPSQPGQLSESEQREVEDLQARDREVKAHELAHKAAAGQYARGAPSYSYQQGPDGRRYAVGGEVGIDTGPVAGDPEATLRKASTIRAAAMAPAQPSSQDRSVAASAATMAAEARQQIFREQQEERAESAEERSRQNEATTLGGSAVDNDRDAGNDNSGKETAGSEGPINAYRQNQPGPAAPSSPGRRLDLHA